MPPCPTIQEVEPKLMMTPCPNGLHARQHGLRREELMLQVYRDPVVPILRRYLLGRVPFVMRRVVDEDRGRPVRLACVCDARAQRRDVGEIDTLKIRGEPLAGQLPRKTHARLFIDVEQHDG
jgi:hypothetical protein